MAGESNAEENLIFGPDGLVGMAESINENASALEGLIPAIGFIIGSVLFILSIWKARKVKPGSMASPAQIVLGGGFIASLIILNSWLINAIHKDLFQQDAIDIGSFAAENASANPYEAIAVSALVLVYFMANGFFIKGLVTLWKVNVGEAPKSMDSPVSGGIIMIVFSMIAMFSPYLYIKYGLPERISEGHTTGNIGMSIHAPEKNDTFYINNITEVSHEKHT